MKIQFFWNVTLCPWVSGSWHYKRSECLNLQIQAVQCEWQLTVLSFDTVFLSRTENIKTLPQIRYWMLSSTFTITIHKNLTSWRIQTLTKTLTKPFTLTYLLTYLLTPCSTALLEKLTSFQLVKKFPAFYRTQRFITTNTSASHLSLSWASSIQSTPPHPTFWGSILILSSHLWLGLPSGLLPSGFTTKTLYTPLLSSIRTTCTAHLNHTHISTIFTHHRWVHRSRPAWVTITVLKYDLL